MELQKGWNVGIKGQQNNTPKYKIFDYEIRIHIFLSEFTLVRSGAQSQTSIDPGVTKSGGEEQFHIDLNTYFSLDLSPHH